MSGALEMVNSKTTKKELIDLLTSAELGRQEATSELEEFKNRVYQVAVDRKAELNWCDEGFNSAMTELGIKAPAQFKKVTIVAYVDMLAPDGPCQWEIGDLGAEDEDSDVAEAVISGLDYYDRETISVSVETVDEKPEKLMTEKKTVYGNRYIGGGF